MGVYLCLGQSVHTLNHTNALPIQQFSNFKSIHEYVEKNEKIFLFLGQGLHKIKRKAEQIACNEAIQVLNLFNTDDVNIFEK